MLGGDLYRGAERYRILRVARTLQEMGGVPESHVSPL